MFNFCRALAFRMITVIIKMFTILDVFGSKRNSFALLHLFLHSIAVNAFAVRVDSTKESTVN